MVAVGLHIGRTTMVKASCIDVEINDWRLSLLDVEYRVVELARGGIQVSTYMQSDRTGLMLKR